MGKFRNWLSQPVRWCRDPGFWRDTASNLLANGLAVLIGLVLARLFGLLGIPWSTILAALVTGLATLIIVVAVLGALSTLVAVNVGTWSRISKMTLPNSTVVMDMFGNAYVLNLEDAQEDSGKDDNGDPNRGGAPG